MATGKSKFQIPKSKIVIAGGGPAGASAAIRLAGAGFEVALVERDRFPRHKLCGEFISPESLGHFRDLGILDEMLAAGGERIAETVFYSQNGRSIAVPSRWFGGDALSLSRAAMDDILLRRAQHSGVEVIEQTAVCGVETDDKGMAAGIRVRAAGRESFITGDFFIDATGRSAVLARFLEKQGGGERERGKPEFIAFKNHLRNAGTEPGRCEIYFYPGGYGGLSQVEGGAVNFCFLVRSERARALRGDPESLIDGVICRNKRAREVLRGREAMLDWMAVSIKGFGSKEPSPAPNVFAAGDAGAFVDPFTGSGMLMALQSAEILAKCIAENSAEPHRIAEQYKLMHSSRFGGRLRVCSLLRRAAQRPFLHEPAISLLGLSQNTLSILARATR